MIQESVHNGIEKLEHKLSNSRCMVAMTEGKVVGTFSLAACTLHRWPHIGCAMCLHTLAVDPEYQGHHIADKLLDNHIAYINNIGGDKENSTVFCSP